MNINKLAFAEYENVRSLFHESDTNSAAIFGVIEGLIPGQIWTDNQNNCCLIICEDSYCLMAGKVNKNIFQDFFVLLKQKRNVRLQYQPKTNIDQLNLLDFGFTIIPRREYKYKNVYVEIPKYENKTGYVLKQIKDEKTFNLCLWKQLILDIYLDAKTYLKNGTGFVLMDVEKQLVVSEAHGICSKKSLEIATVTDENFRGQNLATVVCNHLIHYALNKNLNPVWSCNETNIASCKVAEHQGMDEITKYSFYALEQ